MYTINCPGRAVLLFLFSALTLVASASAADARPAAKAARGFPGLRGAVPRVDFTSADFKKDRAGTALYFTQHHDSFSSTSYAVYVPKDRSKPVLLGRRYEGDYMGDRISSPYAAVERTEPRITKAPRAMRGQLLNDVAEVRRLSPGQARALANRIDGYVKTHREDSPKVPLMHQIFPEGQRELKAFTRQMSR